MAHICSTIDGNTLALVIAAVRLVPVDTSCLDLLVAIGVDRVARGAAHGVERFDQRHAGGEHGGQRARPAGDARLVDQGAEDRHLEHAGGP